MDHSCSLSAHSWMIPPPTRQAPHNRAACTPTETSPSRSQHSCICALHIVYGLSLAQKIYKNYINYLVTMVLILLHVSIIGLLGDSREKTPGDLRHLVWIFIKHNWSTELITLFTCQGLWANSSQVFRMFLWVTQPSSPASSSPFKTMQAPLRGDKVCYRTHCNNHHPLITFDDLHPHYNINLEIKFC